MRTALALLALLMVAACDGEGDTPDGGGAGVDASTCEPSCEPGACGDDGCGGTCACGSGERCEAEACVPGLPLELSTEALETGADGEVSVSLAIDAHRSFMVVATTETDANLAVLFVRDPAGARVLRWQDWYDGSRGLTNAFWASDPTTVVNWPVRAVDPALSPGEYLVRVGSYEADGVTARPGVPIEVTTITARDDDLGAGTVHVAVIWAAGMDEDLALVEATERAVAHWREVWAPIGLELSLRYLTSEVDPALPYPDAPARSVISAASALAEDGEVPLVIGETIADGTATYGVSGQLPGPVVPSSLSAIVISWLANAGRDGVFSDDDVRLYGEVLAHEVGHYLGLFHPVSNSYDYWDALDDTEECGGELRCERILGTNVMFPYSICEAGVCVSTTELTPDQQGVMHRYTGTR